MNFLDLGIFQITSQHSSCSAWVLGFLPDPDPALALGWDAARACLPQEVDIVLGLSYFFGPSVGLDLLLTMCSFREVPGMVSVPTGVTVSDQGYEIGGTNRSEESVDLVPANFHAKTEFHDVLLTCYVEERNARPVG